MPVTINGTTGISTPGLTNSSGDMTITNGNLVLGTSGKGIDFSATSSGSGTMTSELLSDYEEGTWTPAFSFSNGNTGVTYTERSGKYTKIGRQVVVEATIILSSKGSSTGRIEIGGLPFTATSDEYTGAIEMRNVTFTQKYAIVEVGRSSGTFFRVMLIDSGANSTECADTNVANNSGFLFTATYFV